METCQQLGKISVSSTSPALDRNFVGVDMKSIQSIYLNEWAEEFTKAAVEKEEADHFHGPDGIDYELCSYKMPDGQIFTEFLQVVEDITTGKDQTVVLENPPKMIFFLALKNKEPVVESLWEPEEMDYYIYG